MCGKGRDDRGGGVVEEVKYRPLIPLANHPTPILSLSPAQMLSGMTPLRLRAHPYEEPAYEVYKMEDV